MLRIEPAEERGDRRVICVALGEWSAYLSDDDGVALFPSVDAAMKFIRATRPDLAENVGVAELVDVEAASRPADPTPGIVDREGQP